MGHNLLTLHGLYYSTHGGWWEWAPPCNHFRMPYWRHMSEFLRAPERLSYLLSQGYHRTDVAILYPVAAMEAGPGGKDAVTSAFDLGTYLYNKGIDFDFMDFESLARAQVKDRELQVSGERYRVLVLPSMRTVRYSTLEKALEFHRAGGIVVALGVLPEASDRIGRDDPQLDATVKEIVAAQARASTPAEVEALVNASFPRDFVCEASAQNPYVLHRKAGARDIYMVYGVPKGAQCTFRSAGAVESWDVWSGGTETLPVLSQNDGITQLRMPLEETEAQLIVFAPGKPQIAPSNVEGPPERIPVQGTWDFELKPALDNRWGDYRLPASNTFIGAEARRFRYAEANGSQTTWANPSLDDSSWQTVTESYGPHFWKLGPFPPDADLSELETRLAKLTSVDPSKPVEFAGTQYRWQSYEYSMRWGAEQDPGHQGYHGLKGEMPKDFITLGKPRTKSTAIVYEPEPTGVRHFLWTSPQASRPMDARLSVGGEIIPSIWINGVSLASGAESARLKGGSNPVLLRYDRPGRGHFMLGDPSSPAGWKQTHPVASLWYNKPGVLPLDTRPEVSRPTGWYRFTAPPGLRSMKIAAHGSVRVWVAGRPAAVKPGTKRQDGSVEYIATVAQVSATTENVTLRVNQQRGVYGGAAIAEPIALECAPGKIAPGDWSLIDGLASYSGGAFYRKTITLTPRQAQGRVVLDLGKVSASVEVHANGQKAGVRVAPPWKVDISRYVRGGENWIELLIFNTLANHYQTIPTRYRGSSISGLIGPVNLEIGKD